jgi:hypothetical protein
MNKQTIKTKKNFLNNQSATLFYSDLSVFKKKLKIFISAEYSEELFARMFCRIFRELYSIFIIFILQNIHQNDKAEYSEE